MDRIHTSKKRAYRPRGHTFPIGEKTYVMGILNVTPDSFSDGGRYCDPGEAVERAMDMVKEGADILDIGGESTRPGHRDISAEEEARRVLPVIRRLKERTDAVLSIDTSKASVARAAIEAGAAMINDVRSLKADPDMVKVAAETGAGLVLMYNATPLPGGMADPDPSWSGESGLFAKIIRQLTYSLDLAARHGIGTDRILVDPGIGFGVTAEESCEILQKLPTLAGLGMPILIGPSRKSFIGAVLDVPVGERLIGTAAAVALGIAGGADFIRVHDVPEMTQVARMSDAILRRQYDG